MSRPIPEAAPTHQQAVKLGDERRQRIIDLISELLTGGQIETHELNHFAVMAHWLGLKKIVQDVAADGAIACGDRGARECLLALVLAAMQRLIADPEPVAPVAPVKRPVGRPLGPKRVRQYAGEYARRIEKLGPEKAAEFKARERDRIREARARKRLVPAG
jgi:hypothetical protein